MDFFNTPIHSWYSLSKRDLPWRNTKDPYLIWLSEIILQQTRVDQGLAYYRRFTEEFQTISQLANASENQILKFWQGLGYYSRARNLHFTAKYIFQFHNGEFPDDYLSIRSLKGVGDYTAAAIASISFGLEIPAVDGNVYRVLSRFFGISEPIDTSIGKKVFFNLAKELIKGTDPGMHNQALMEFGALQCTPNNPNCEQCPINKKCFAFSTNRIYELPVKLIKTKKRDRYFNYLVIIVENHTWLRQRIKNDIWKKLYEFPMVESTEETNLGILIETDEFRKIVHTDHAIIENVSNWKIHLLSHQRIHYRFIRIRLADEISAMENLIQVNKEDIFNFAVPKLLESYIFDIGL